MSEELKAAIAFMIFAAILVLGALGLSTYNSIQSIPLQEKCIAEHGNWDGNHNQCTFDK